MLGRTSVENKPTNITERRKGELSSGPRAWQMKGPWVLSAAISRERLNNNKKKSLDSLVAMVKWQTLVSVSVVTECHHEPQSKHKIALLRFLA